MSYIVTVHSHPNLPCVKFDHTKIGSVITYSNKEYFGDPPPTPSIPDYNATMEGGFGIVYGWKTNKFYIHNQTNPLYKINNKFK